MADIAEKTQAAPAEHVTGSVSTGWRYYVVFLLMLVGTANFFHRQILSILLEPIRHELSLSDTQVGLLTGPAFALINVVLSIPVARLADRWSRRKVIAIAVTLWSTMTMLCGVAHNFFQLFLARAGVGAGQSGGSAPSHAFVGDLFPRETRSTAIAFFLLFTPIGNGLGFFWGGWGVEHVGWRDTFIYAGMPGIALGLLAVLTLPESRKGLADGVQAPLKQLPLGAALRLLWSIPSMRFMVIGSTLQTFLQLGLTLWVPSFLTRSYGMTPTQRGTGMALVFAIGMTLGTMSGGRLIDMLGRRDLRWHFWVPTIAIVAAVSCSVGAFTLPRQYVFWLLGAQITFGTLFASSFTAITQSLVPIAVRATVVAGSLFIVNGFAIGIGPAVMGVVSDALHRSYGEESLRVTLIGGALTALPAAIFYFLASRIYRADIAAADARNEAAQA